ncbi:deoxyribonuclease [Roseiconus nitratireducens]|uniref:Deoxyribonuclease n=1 Tax=Roseiconus nitratireducens TaxID=2605748 RepID=A0A5M6D161_9BACT|nr:deoxyribonuclease [Roseiconus nitratireducens]KAA5540022.1 deoxyribonuclease [Roseiconus nitratireducens]
MSEIFYSQRGFRELVPDNSPAARGDADGRSAATEIELGIFSKRRRKSALAPNRSVLRWLGPAATLLGLLYIVFLMLTGGLDFAALDTLRTSDDPSGGRPVSLAADPTRPAESLRIASFRIREFSEEGVAARSRQSGVDVMDAIAAAVTRFDVIAIQDVRGPSGAAVKQLIQRINQAGGQYAATLSDPIGEQDRPESYALLWDQSRVELLPGSSYVVRDDADRMYREPMVASFRARLPNGHPGRPFRFTIINVRTDPQRVDPDSADNEIRVLADVFQRVRQYESEQHGEDDFLLVGNLNSGAAAIADLLQIPGVVSLVGVTDLDASGGEDSPDHILIDRGVTAEYTERTGQMDPQRDLGLTPEQATAVSDRFPVWAEFGRYEIPPILHAQSAGKIQTRLIR